ncbi:MAG TPA: universal stress protein [Thermoanaerobaculia bacterium]|nr:universal stress protein [Thermoanaerobaculia bacterium]
MTILCATDFSEAADKACEIAAAIAVQHGEPLALVHAITPIAAPPKYKTSGHLHELRASAEQALHALAQRIGAVEAATHVETGTPDEVVLEHAAKIAARLIIVASVGKDAVEWLLGSTAERIVARSSIPVLIVRGDLPVGDWLHGRRPLRVAVAADLGSGTRATIDWATHLPEHGPCEFVVAHVSWPPEEFERLAIEPPMHLDRTHPLVAEVVGRELSHAASRLRGSAETKTIVETDLGTSAAAIVSIAERERADLLVVGKRGSQHRHWWDQSVSRGVVRRAVMSVACIPEIEDETRLPEVHVRRILAATDFSELGNAAVAYALRLGAGGAEVLLVHVLEDEDVSSAEKSRRAGLLERFGAADRARTEILAGDDVAHYISAAAERFGADLICVGSRGRTGLARAFLGSVSQSVLLRSRRPVLIIQSAESAP